MISILISLLPVIVFIFFIFYLDSYKLVKPQLLCGVWLWGSLSAAGSYFVNTFLMDFSGGGRDVYSRGGAQIGEEFLKGILLIYLFKRNKIGFLIDGAILGFSIGAGFSFVENLYYALTMGDVSPMIWIIRGFGTAIMHCGTTTLLTLTIAGISQEGNAVPLKAFLTGLALAVIIHSLYNQFLLNPLVSTLIVMTVVPLAIAVVFQNGEKKLREWMEIELSSEVELLSMIKEGEFGSTKSGKYLLHIKDRFAPEVVFDMLNYVRIYLELSVKAKSVLLLREAGFEPVIEREIEEKLNELKFLESSVGRTGLLALAPMLRMDRKSLWKINMLTN